MPRAGAQRSRLSPLLKALAQASPVLPDRCSQLRSVGACTRVAVAAISRAEPRRTAPGDVVLRRRRAPLMITLGAEQMFEVVVGTRQVGHHIGVEQPRAVSAHHLLEMT